MTEHEKEQLKEQMRKEFVDMLHCLELDAEGNKVSLYFNDIFLTSTYVDIRQTRY